MTNSADNASERKTRKYPTRPQGEAASQRSASPGTWRMRKTDSGASHDKDRGGDLPPLRLSRTR